MDKDPNTLEEALRYLKSAVANQRVIFGSKKPEVKRVSFGDEADNTEETEPVVRALYQQTGKTLEQRLKKTEEDIRETRATVDRICKLLTESNFGRRSNSPIRASSPHRSEQCFNCGSENHFIRDCPKPRNQSPRRFVHHLHKNNKVRRI